jgi:hypothetical protein
MKQRRNTSGFSLITFLVGIAFMATAVLVHTHVVWPKIGATQALIQSGIKTSAQIESLRRSIDKKPSDPITDADTAQNFSRIAGRLKGKNVKASWWASYRFETDKGERIHQESAFIASYTIDNTRKEGRGTDPSGVVIFKKYAPG